VGIPVSNRTIRYQNAITCHRGIGDGAVGGIRQVDTIAVVVDRGVGDEAVGGKQQVDAKIVVVADNAVGDDAVDRFIQVDTIIVVADSDMFNTAVLDTMEIYPCIGPSSAVLHGEQQRLWYLPVLFHQLHHHQYHDGR